MEELVKKPKRSPRKESIDGEDRISALPDSLLHHILSFLEMGDVIVMSPLSRRWRNLWTTVPTLDFGYWKPGRGPDAATYIGLALMLYEGRKIQRFRVHLDCTVDACHIDSWIRFATRRDVEELDMKFNIFYDPSDDDALFKMPGCLFDCGALQVLRLQVCDLTGADSFCFGSLTTLDLCDVKLPDLDISGCPLLENLIIEDCRNNLDIYAPNQKLRYLKIHHSDTMLEEDDGYHTIYAPNLLSIELRLSIWCHCTIKNLSSIECASLDFCGNDEWFNEKPEDDFMQSPLLDGWPDDDHIRSHLDLIKNLSHAKTLKLWGSFIRVVTVSESRKLKTPPLSAPCLELITSLDQLELPGMASLLRSSYSLESLILNIDDHKEFSPKINDCHWELLELALSASLPLKTIKIHKFLERKAWLPFQPQEQAFNMDRYLENCENEIKLVKILLEGCKMLDETASFLEVLCKC